MARITYEFEEVSCLIAGRETLATGSVEIEYDVSRSFECGRWWREVDWRPIGAMTVSLFDVERESNAVLTTDDILFHDILGRREDDIEEACVADSEMLEDSW